MTESQERKLMEADMDLARLLVFLEVLVDWWDEDSLAKLRQKVDELNAKHGYKSHEWRKHLQTKTFSVR